MIFEPKEIELKNGITAILKTPQIEDGEMLLNSIKTSSGETNFLSRYLEDWDGVTVESEEKWISDVRESDKTLVIACYIDGKIVGNCDINFLSGSKTFHRAVLGIAIIKDYWNLGIGSAMFTELIEAAQEHKDTEIVELEFLEGNNRGQALYEKFGFKIVSVKPKACKLKDGTYQDLIYMQRWV